MLVGLSFSSSDVLRNPPVRRSWDLEGSVRKRRQRLKRSRWAGAVHSSHAAQTFPSIPPVTGVGQRLAPWDGFRNRIDRIDPPPRPMRSFFASTQTQEEPQLFFFSLASVSRSCWRSRGHLVLLVHLVLLPSSHNLSSLQ